MPTKPTTQPKLWASNAVYSIGPKQFEDTKLDPSGAEGDGFIPGANFPTAGNHFNWQVHFMSALDIWTFLGTFNPDEDAHVVETASDGTLNFARGVVSGHSAAAGPSLLVGDTPGTDPALKVDATNGAAIFSNATGTAVGMQISSGAIGGSEIYSVTKGASALSINLNVATALGCRGMTVRGTGADDGDATVGGVGIDVQGGAEDGPTAGGVGIVVKATSEKVPALQAKHTGGAAAGPVIDVEGAFNATPIVAVQTGGRQPAMRLSATSVATHISAPLVCVPQAPNLLGDGVEEGSLYVSDDPGNPEIVAWRTFINSAFKFLRHTTVACYGYLEVTQADTAGAAGTNTDIGTLEFHGNHIPSSTGDVEILLIWREKVTGPNPGGSHISAHIIEMIDDTENPLVVEATIPVDIIESADAAGATVRQSRTEMIHYLLPGAGQRSLRFRHRKSDAGNTDEFRINDFKATVRGRFAT